MGTYTTEKNNRKVKRYRLRKKLKEEGYSDEEIARELQLLDEELGYETSAPGHEEYEESEESGDYPFPWVSLGVMLGIPALFAIGAYMLSKRGA